MPPRPHTRQPVGRELSLAGIGLLGRVTRPRADERSEDVYDVVSLFRAALVVPSS